jgi:phosphoglycerol transferase MdoB-like AlkP superfamily enzyme
MRWWASMSDIPDISRGASALSALPGGSNAEDCATGRQAAGPMATRIALRAWALVVFSGLALLKVVMVIGQGESLYEAHWRVGAVRMDLFSYVGFAAFVALGVMGLVQLQKSCRSAGLKAVRATNAVVLCTGIVFLVLTLHNGDKNFFYPVLSGVLPPSSVGPYLANAFFFNQPFLAGWLFVYAACYYVMARTKRESGVLGLTAVFACVYALIFLQEFMLHRDELLIIDCAGLCSVMLARRSHSAAGDPAGRLHPAWFIVPVAWAVLFGWALLRFDDSWHTNPARYFVALSALTSAIFLAASLVIRRGGCPAAWNWLVPFFFAAFFLLVNRNYPASSNYRHLLCLALTFPRYFAGDMILVSAVFVAALGVAKLRPSMRTWWVDLAGLGLLVIGALDLRLTQIMGVRLGWDVLSFGDSPRMMFKMAKPYLPGAIAWLVIATVVYILVLHALRLWLARRNFNGAPVIANWRAGQAGYYVCALFTALACLGAVTAESDKAQSQSVFHFAQTSPLWKHITSHPMNRDEFFNSASALGLGDFSAGAQQVPVQPPRNLNVLVVFMESSYNKHLSLFGSDEETQPLLSKYKDRMEIFPNFFSAFTGSIHARFATFTSLYPVQDFQSFTQEHVPVKSLFEVFHDQGYACSMFYSSYFDYTGFRDFLKNRGLDEMYDADTMPGQRSTKRVEWGLLEEETLGAIRGQLKKYAQSHQRFCLTYVPAAPHYPYDQIPKPFQKHKLTEPGDYKPLYLNELLYMDWVLASILDQLKDSGLLDNTLVLITNDHGEMLGGKDGNIGHGWRVTPELANTPLILIDPAKVGFRINKTIGCQVDLLPTLLDRLHIPQPVDQLYQGKSLDSGSARSGEYGFLNSYKQFGILHGDQLFLGDRENSSNPGDVYSITNEGPKTIFTQDDKSQPGIDPQAIMSRFDAFQISLLRNYAYYSGLVKPMPGSNAKLAQK